MRNKLLITLFSTGTILAGHKAMAVRNPVTFLKGLPAKVTTKMSGVKDAVKTPFVRAKTSASGFYDRVKGTADRLTHPFAPKISKEDAAYVRDQMGASGGKPDEKSITILASLMGEKDVNNFVRKASMDKGYQQKMQKRLQRAVGSNKQLAQARQ